MKNSFKYDKKVISQILEMVEDENLTKPEVQSRLVGILEVDKDFNRFSWIDKYIRHSGVKFKKSGGNWDIIVSYFRETEVPTQEGMVKALIDEGLTEPQAKKYGSSYWYVLNEIYLLDK